MVAAWLLISGVLLLEFTVGIFTRTIAARARVFAACKANRIFFLNAMNPNNVVDMIKEGVMVGPASQRAAEIGRQYTKRTLPW